MKAEHAGSLSVAALALLMAWLPSAPAQACSCVTPAGSAVWPRDGSVGVPRDTPIVVDRRTHGVPTTEIQIVLTSASGDRIALEEQRVLPEITPSCSFEETVFLRPAEPLAAGERYTIDFELEDDAGVDLRTRPSTFTTGDAMREASAPPALDVTYLHVAATGDCAGDWCEIAEVMLALDAPTLVPYWLAVETHAAVENRNRMRLLPAAWFPASTVSPKAVQASVVLPRGDRCVHIAVYGFDGAALIDEERCAPDRCALFDTRTADSCEQPPSTALDVARVPRDNCDDPYVVPHDRFGNATYDAGVEDAGTAPPTGEAGSDADAGAPMSSSEPMPNATRDDAGMDASAADDCAAAEGATYGCTVRAARGSPSAFYVWLAIALLASRRQRKTT